MSRYHQSLGVFHWLAFLEQRVQAHWLNRKSAKTAVRPEASNLTALESLIKQLDDRNQAACIRAIRALSKYNEGMNATRAAEALVLQIKSSNLSVRWAAIDSLIKMERTSMKPLLTVLTREYHSTNLREGARRILQTLNQNGLLRPEETRVYQALKMNQTGIEVASRANHALIAFED